MKNLLLLFFLFLSIFVFSQRDGLINNQWFLAKVEIEEQDFYPPNDELTGLTVFTENFSETQLCNSINLEYSDLTDSQFLLTAFTSTLIECPDQPGLEYIEEKYSSLFWFSENQIFQYAIETDPEWAHIQSLIITNQEGNKAYFMNDALSTSEVSKNKIQISLNPVKNKLTIQNSGLKTLNVQIIDTNGKLLFNTKINSYKTEMNFSHYPKGIYFATFESEGKILKTEKIIKK